MSTKDPDPNELRIDESDGQAYTFPEVRGWFRNAGWSMTHINQRWSMMQPFKKPELRFSQGDRVLCNVGQRRLPGTVLSLNVEDPEEPNNPMSLIPYVVKTDNLPGVVESRTISAPSDVDMVICRDRCFNSKSEMDFAKWAAPTAFDKKKPLRFGIGDEVAIRVKDRPDGYEQWRDGKITAVWASIQGPKGEGFLKPAEAVPYVVSLSPHPQQTYYCHLDDHTLIRKPENKPRKLRKTLSKRFEVRQADGGALEKFDHVTLRSKIVQDMSESEGE